MSISQLIVIVNVTIALFIVGAMDARDQERHEEFYCAMVNEGSWKPYNEKIDCDTK